MLRNILTATILLLLIAAPLAADSIMLKTGKKLSGKIVAEHSDRVEIKLSTGEVKSVPRSDIVTMKKGTSKLDEYKSRYAAAKGDVAALVELAQWCDEQKLRRQKKTCIARILRLDADCPEAHILRGEIWGGSKWIPDPDKGAVPPPAGEKITLKEFSLEVVVPKGWKKTKSGPDGYAFATKERYKHAVLIEIGKAGEGGYDAEDGWSDPTEVAAGPLKGTWVERTADGVKTREHVVAGSGHRILIRYSALALEFNDWVPHVAKVLEKIEVLAPELDFTSKTLGIGFCHPKEPWQVHELKIEGAAGLNGGAVVLHRGEEATDYARLLYIQSDAGSALSSEGSLSKIGVSTGDIKERGESTVGSMKAEFLDMEVLDGGIPMRNLRYVAKHEGKVHLLQFTCHERSIERFRPVFDQIRNTFTIGIK